MAEDDLNQKHIDNRRKCDQVRLESWKAIANFLNRSVRTVRRWEESEGLPVYRLRDKRGNSVYAFEAELEAWRSTHANELPTLDSVSPRERSKPVLVSYIVGSLMALLIGVLASGYFLSEIDSVSPEIERAAAVESSAKWPNTVVVALMEPVYSAWAEGRVDSAYSESQRVARHLPDLPLAIKRELLQHLVAFSISLGRIEDATSFSETADSDGFRNELMVSIAFASGDKQLMSEIFGVESDFQEMSTALYMSMVGLNDRAIELASASVTASDTMSRKNVILALAAMQAGNQEAARMLFAEAVESLTVEDKGFYFVASDMLSGIYTGEGDLDTSIRLLESMMPKLDIALANESGIFWLMCQRNLAALYRNSGRLNEADDVENMLRKQLALADQTFPLAKSLAGV